MIFFQNLMDLCMHFSTHSILSESRIVRSTRTTRVTLQLFTTNENTCVMEVKEGFPREKPPTDVICFSCNKGVASI